LNKSDSASAVIAPDIIKMTINIKTKTQHPQPTPINPPNPLEKELVSLDSFMFMFAVF
jgi:hypothetical protein